MKIIFFSDAHGNRYAIDQFFEDVKTMAYDRIIFGGDIFGYYYEQEYILSVLRGKMYTVFLATMTECF